MELKDILTLIVAIYAAILSTILGLLKLRKGKKIIRVIFKIQVNMEAQLTVVNIGYRPVTITHVALQRTRIGYSGGTWVNYSSIEGSEIYLPETLKDGEQITMKIQNDIFEDLFSDDDFIKIYADDAQGHRYVSKKYKLKRELYDLMDDLTPKI